MRPKLLAFLLALLPLLPLFAQSDNIVKNQGIISPVHQANTGKIAFTATEIPVTQIKEQDFLRSFELTNKTSLYINVFMDNSMTNYLHQLAPALAADSLVKKGNYQFALLIDGRPVYQSNLLPGAPQAKAQDTATTISKPLIDNQRQWALWSQSFWERFMNNGGDAALTEGKHLLRMEIRPYINIDGNIKVGGLIAAGELPLLVRRKPAVDLAKVRLNPITPYNGLVPSTEKFNSNKIKALKAYVEDGAFRKINGVVVLSNGKLLVEEYFNGESRATLHDPRSVGKTFTGSITGIAIQEGYLKNEQQTLREFYDLRAYANYTAIKEEVAIKDLLTMSAVFDGNDADYNSPGNEENMYPTDNWVKFALDLPVNTTMPKGQWHYFTAGVVVLGDILNKRVPGGLEKYADEKLFKPLGITHYKWQYTPQQVPNTAGGLQLTALDFAKYGQLYKNGGKWNGNQIIPAAWVSQTFTRHKSLPDRSNEYYGYLFWNKTYTVAGKSYEAFYCTGNGGNKIFVFKDQPWVVVITASAYGASYAHPQADKMMQEYILPALID
ncbi:serine hydrolase [Chitinophaga agrisoli]|uniref:Serine hydrolase n=1 Tax=Chitinophaga agrisoli TaxID=2607653 RepID=A0A5B2VKK1_9BACT|nr:serine hydrolase [Chitinophaga agrisoli]KAA2240133.1 serine hydrolase [Chitinophaga agrisoli]